MIMMMMSIENNNEQHQNESSNNDLMNMLRPDCIIRFRTWALDAKHNHCDVFLGSLLSHLSNLFSDAARCTTSDRERQIENERKRETSLHMKWDYYSTH